MRRSPAAGELLLVTVAAVAVAAVAVAAGCVAAGIRVGRSHAELLRQSSKERH